MRRIGGLGFAAAVAAWVAMGAVRQDASLASAAPVDAVAALRSGIQSLVAHPARSGVWGVLAVSIDRGDTLFELGSARPLAPASNLKLLTSAAALYYMGAEYRFQTFLLADGPVRNGVLAGNLYLYGTGDPMLGRRFDQRPAAALVAFADTLAALGVREVHGDVVGDGSYFRGPGAGAGWLASYLPSWYAAPAGALSVHENLVRLVVKPGAAPGARPVIEFVPGGRGIALVNLAATGGSGGIRVRRFDFEAPILVEGTIASGSSTHAVPVGDPARYAAAVFRDLLEERGIFVHGGVRAILDPAESPVTGRKVFAPTFDTLDPLRLLAVHASPPLATILHVINHQSHNFYADQVLRSVGRVATGDGSVRGGERAIRELLRRAGADAESVKIMDGCGLSPLNRVSAGTFVALLDFMIRSPVGPEFFATLPAAGEAERFRRMGGTAAQGNLRAKTGTIDSVSALSGYVRTADGERIAFSIISNGVASTANSKHVENLIGIQLAEFSRRSRPASPAEARQSATTPANEPERVAR